MPDTLDTLRRTGADGRDVLESLDDAARGRLVRLEAGLQRRVVAASDALSTGRVESFLRWYDGLSSRAKRQVREAAETAGDSVPRFLARADADTRDVVMTDGGKSLDDIGRAIDDIEHQHVEAFLDDAPDAGPSLLQKLDPGTDTRLLRLHEAGDLDGDALQRMDDLLDSGDMDDADVDRMMGMLEAKDSDPLLGSDVSANGLLEVASRNGDLSDARWVTTVPDDTPGLDADSIWLENGIPGDDGTGWQHIVDEHREDFVNRYPSVENSNDIEHIVYDALDNPDRVTVTSEGKARFVYTVSGERGPMNVIVGSNGFVQSAYPIN